MSLDIPTARVYLPLLGHFRYKGLRGGRGSGKSHVVADNLISDVLTGHHRTCCAREYQASIDESSKQLLEDKIRHFQLEHAFRVTDQEIVGPHDSLFSFIGLHGRTAESMKSMEGYDRFWNEEAHTTSQRSLELITPTFRAEGAEMYFSWNPSSPKDPVDRLFLENRGDPDFCLVEAGFRDNPWFGGGMQRDMERDRRRDPDKYAHVWLGRYKVLSGSRVFANWSIEAFETPADAAFRLGADWGFSVDPTVLVRCWEDRPRKRLYVDHEAYAVGCRIDDTPALFERVPGSKRWPIRADSARPETIDYMRRHGYPRMEPAAKGPNSVADGVEFLKSYDIVVHPRCVRTADELSSYSYRVDKHTGEVLPVLEDKKNHVVDSLRYAVEGLRKSKSLEITPDFAVALAALTRAGRAGHQGAR